MTQFGHASSLIRAFIIGGAFLCMQIAAVEHAAAHGDTGHSHDGVPCLIQILSDGPTTPVVGPALSSPAPAASRTVSTTFRCHTGQRLDHSHAIRAPPSLPF